MLNLHWIAFSANWSNFFLHALSTVTMKPFSEADHLTYLLRRLRHEGKRIPDLSTEPNFYQMTVLPSVRLPSSDLISAATMGETLQNIQEWVFQVAAKWGDIQPVIANLNEARSHVIRKNILTRQLILNSYMNRSTILRRQLCARFRRARALGLQVVTHRIYMKIHLTMVIVSVTDIVALNLSNLQKIVIWVRVHQIIPKWKLHPNSYRRRFDERNTVRPRSASRKHCIQLRRSAITNAMLISSQRYKFILRLAKEWMSVLLLLCLAAPILRDISPPMEALTRARPDKRAMSLT